MRMDNYYNLDDITNRGEIATEQNNPRSKDIDLLPTHSLVELFCEEDKIPQIAVSNAKEQIINAIDSISVKLRQGGRLFYLGAGTSGRLGVLDAAECPPTFCTPPEMVQGLIAGGISSLIKSSEQLEDITTLAYKDLEERQFNDKDCLVGISAGGTTEYVLSGLKYAMHNQALAISICCVPYHQVNIPCDIDIRLVTGPELISGSTRLKAGTATKMALNIISTGVMIKLGKVYDNKMVDMAITNNKLLDRSLRILKEIANIDREKALTLLSRTNGSVKLSILIALTGLDMSQASQMLSDNEDNVRKALDSYRYNLIDS